jgi:serine/threonine-protein kinase
MAVRARLVRRGASAGKLIVSAEPHSEAGYEMQSTNWPRAKELFLAALDRPEPERVAFLTRECAGDDELLADVRRLLDASVHHRSPLDSLADAARDVLGGRATHPTHIGRYRVESVLGEGGMGVVYLAVHEDLESRVAIKVLRDAALSPQRREWFLREERLLAQLNHPGIARLFDAEVLADGTPYFVMEYVDGEPITTFCERRRLSIPERVAIFRDACAAVQQAHRQAILHRDLKPSNIFVSVAPDGNATVKLLDFGIARQLGSTERASPLATASRLMTPAYAAPEQLAGGAVGVHSDVFALGVVLYELLAGSLPYDPETRASATHSVATTSSIERPSARARRSLGAIPVSSANASTWSELDVLCLTAMHEDPTRRYQTVESLLRDLDHLRAGEPLDARPDSLGYRAGKFFRRHRAAVLSTAVVAFGAMALVTFFTVRLTAARDAARAQTDRAERLQTFTLDMFKGDDDVALPETASVRTILDRGLVTARNERRDPAFQASLLVTLGGLYRQMGDFARADSLLRAGLAQRRALHHGDHIDLAYALIGLGQLRMNEGKYDEADSLTRAAFAMARRVAEPGEQVVIEATDALGMLRVQQGQYGEAIDLLKEAVRLHGVRGADSATINETTNLLANALYFAGRYAEAEPLNRQVLDWDRRRLGNGHVSISHSLVNLGNIAFERERYDEAERAYREALAINTRYNGPDDALTQRDIQVLGRTLMKRKQYAEARVLLDRALAMSIKIYGGRHPRTAIALASLGSLANFTGDAIGAESYFDRALGIVRESLGEKHSFFATAQVLLARAYEEQRKDSLAESMFRAGIRGLTASLSSDHPITADARVKFGKFLSRQRRFADAERELVAARAAFVAVGVDAPPSVLRDAREALVTVYTETGRLREAERMRQELKHAGTIAER